MGVDINNLVKVTGRRNIELAMRLVSNVASQRVFYTDLNGLQVSSTAAPVQLIEPAGLATGLAELAHLAELVTPAELSEAATRNELNGPKLVTLPSRSV